MLDTNPDHIAQVLTRGVTEILPSRDTLAALMQHKRLRLYLGIDPTGAELHLGHAVVLRKLQQFAQLGHQVILLVGNGTVRIGDPTGRDASRPMLDDATIQANFQVWQEQASRVLDFNLIEIRHNGDWLDQLTYADMVKLMAKTTVQQLLERDMFQERLKKGLPIYGHEIIYPLLQGYDSVAMDVDLEIGGNDQTFNMMMGRQLQEQYNHRQKWVLSTPLIEGIDGRKMSKSYNNYVKLTENPTDMYGKLMRISDELISKYFTLLTDLPLAEIDAMSQAMQAGDNPMTFKKQLALTVTRDLHDEAAAAAAAATFASTIQGSDLPAEEAFGRLEITGEKINCTPPLSSSELNRRLSQGAVKVWPELRKLSTRQELLDLPAGSKVKLGKRDWYQVYK